MTCPHIITSESTKVCPVCAEAAIAELQNALDFANDTLEDYRTERISLITSRDQLAAEIARLKHQLKIQGEHATARLCNGHIGHWERGRCVLCEHDRLAAENERLREALEKALAAMWDSYYGKGIAVEYVRSVTAECRAALGEGE